MNSTNVYFIAIKNDYSYRYKNLKNVSIFKDMVKKYYKKYENVLEDFKKIDKLLKTNPYKNMGLRDLSLIKK